ncbi:MAG TPA: hypothetical protein VIF32_13860 [Gemmatimonadaceae bacterium]|jgi:hypothetical protein
MATREFTDSERVVWRVWDVTPAHLHPITRAEEYMEPYVGGWLAFESPYEKRRLPAPYPTRWAQYDLPQLEALCRAANPVVKKKKETPSGEQLAITERAAERKERADAEREFTSRRGRRWTVRLHECLRKDGSTEVVLRFTSADSVVDLKDWPSNWKDLRREEFALLLLEAEPPRRLGPGEKTPQRRRDDRPDE